jgi:hypothetical protein
MTIPVAFAVDSRSHHVAAPSLKVDDAEIRNATGSPRFPVRYGAFLIGNGILLCVLFALALWVEVARAAIVFFEHSYAQAHFVADGLRFEARPDVNGLAFVCALIILVIAEVFRAGTRLDEEQSLTI